MFMHLLMNMYYASVICKNIENIQRKVLSIMFSFHYLYLNFFIFFSHIFIKENEFA